MGAALGKRHNAFGNKLAGRGVVLRAHSLRIAKTLVLETRPVE